MVSVFQSLFFFVLTFVVVSPLQAGFSEIDVFEVEVGQGIETGSLNWNISGGPNRVDVLSELEWKELYLWNSRLAAKLLFCNAFSLNFEGDYGQIFHGYCEDSDYSANHRKKLYQYAHTSANRGEVFDLSFFLGYDCCFGGLGVRPLFGYSLSEQHLQMRTPATFAYFGINDPLDPEEVIVREKLKTCIATIGLAGRGFGQDSIYFMISTVFIFLGDSSTTGWITGRPAIGICAKIWREISNIPERGKGFGLNLEEPTICPVA